jgi:hypothetical protein
MSVKVALDGLEKIFLVKANAHACSTFGLASTPLTLTNFEP